MYNNDKTISTMTATERIANALELLAACVYKDEYSGEYQFVISNVTNDDPNDRIAEALEQLTAYDHKERGYLRTFQVDPEYVETD